MITPIKEEPMDEYNNGGQGNGGQYPDDDMYGGGGARIKEERQDEEVDRKPQIVDNGYYDYQQ